MRIQFYETAILATYNGSAPAGVQVLTSPSDPTGSGEPVPYELLLGDFDQDRPLQLPEELGSALAILADPLSAWQEAFVMPGQVDLETVPRSLEANAFAGDLMAEPVIPAETSPFDKQTLVQLAAMAAGGGFFVATGGIPMVVLIGGGVGLVVVRGLNAVSGALWEGARPQVVKLGEDIGEAVVNAIRRRLGLRKPT